MKWASGVWMRALAVCLEGLKRNMRNHVIQFQDRGLNCEPTECDAAVLTMCRKVPKKFKSKHTFRLNKALQQKVVRQLHLYHASVRSWCTRLMITLFDSYSVSQSFISILHLNHHFKGRVHFLASYMSCAEGLMTRQFTQGKKAVEWFADLFALYSKRPAFDSQRS
jgi:hypothetical protein